MTSVPLASPLLPGTAARRYLALHLPLLPSERVRRQRAGQPEAAFALIRKHGGAVILAAPDAQALALGLVPGMTLADARARVPDLIAITEDPAADLACLEWLADGCDRYTPMVAVIPPGTLHSGLVLDITGCSHGYGGDAGLADDIHRRIDRLGLTVQLALGNTPDAALALAVHQLADVEALPVTALAVPEAVHVALRRAGLRCIGDVARQHRPALAARFGPGMTDLLARLVDGVDIHVTPRRLPAPIAVEQRFAAPLAHAEAALAVIESLAVKAGVQLAERGEGGRRFEVALFRSDGHVARLAVDTAAPLRDPKPLIRLLSERIDSLADPLDPGFGYDLLRLEVPVVAPLAAQQLQLEGGSLADSEIDALVDRLTARLGRNRVRRLVAADSHIPEQAAFDLPLAEAIRPSAWSIPAAGEPPLRPLRLFEPPQVIDVIAEVPDGPPRRFRWRRRLHEVTRHEGPERIASEWWRRPDNSGLTRDYYRVEDGDGRRYWLFRHGLYGSEKPNPAWYLHGVFA